MTMDDMINSFSLDKVHRHGARFDMDKAKWINTSHLRMTPNCCLKPFLNIKDGRYSDDKLDMIIDLSKERSNFKSDLKKLDDNYKSVMSDFVDKIDNVDFNSNDSIKSFILDICNKLGIKIGKVMPGLRMALVGGISGPDLMTTMFILGKDQTKLRISKSL